MWAAVMERGLRLWFMIPGGITITTMTMIGAIITPGITTIGMMANRMSAI